jgi:hypothetical protein
MLGVDKRTSRAPGWSYSDLVLVWMCGLGALAGAFGGAFVGYLYGLDQALTAATVPWYAATGLVIGAAAGSLLSLAPAGVLVALRHRRWATAPVRIALTALVGAAPLTLYQLLVSGFAMAGEVIVFCVVVTGAPAGLAAAWLAYRTRRSLRR